MQAASKLQLICTIHVHATVRIRHMYSYQLMLFFFIFSGFSCLNGDEYLDNLGFSDYDVWYNLVALGAFNVFFLTLAYINLRIMKKEK